MSEGEKLEKIDQIIGSTINKVLESSVSSGSKGHTVTSKLFYTLIAASMFFIAAAIVAQGEPQINPLRDLLTSTPGLIAVGLLMIVVLFRIWMVTEPDEASFIAFDKRAMSNFSRYPHVAQRDTMVLGDAVTEELSGEPKVKNDSVVSGFDFEKQMKAIIGSLDYQIDYAEKKASIMLDIGRRFIKWGIWLYVVAIFGWQVYLYYLDFKFGPVIIAGMLSCSFLFVIVEFLGAWYLKQHRHYGDSAYSYMRARSSYHKYILGYCAVVEFMGDDEKGAKEDILKVLSEADKWPDFKDVTSNDFNYMLQAVDSAGVLFEKMKGVFGRSNGDGKPT
ncbi:hypothetical protein [Pseudomonas sp. WCS374]|uniref:hypothetical protein n=1 Tax=Pseudomonas sp. WCS374 TaxID=1495331 RepID=UPI00049A5384|nr:hypothetical protein [Pseudomonas sp. WCS374]AIB40720.1 hypothetical protein PD374_06515 [Pseudomonas sp. WCS374]